MVSTRQFLATLAVLALLASPITLRAQEAQEAGEAQETDAAQPAEDAQEARQAGEAEQAGAARAVPLPNGFDTIRLGLPFAEVERQLRDSTSFDYQGPPDVSLVPQEEQKIIEAEGFTFVERGFFQFYQDRLYIIIIVLNRDEIDHYGMYTTLTAKYGQPDGFSPEQAVWENPDVRMSLERPLTIKYVDRGVFERLRDEAQVEESIRALSREEFLDKF